MAAALAVPRGAGPAFGVSPLLDPDVDVAAGSGGPPTTLSGSVLGCAVFACTPLVSCVPAVPLWFCGLVPCGASVGCTITGAAAVGSVVGVSVAIGVEDGAGVSVGGMGVGLIFGRAVGVAVDVGCPRPPSFWDGAGVSVGVLVDATSVAVALAVAAVWLVGLAVGLWLAVPLAQTSTCPEALLNRVP